MARRTDLEDLVAPILVAVDCELYDLELNGGTLQVVVDRPGGVDLDRLAEVTRQLSVVLDAHDPVAGSYTLEVTSPGLERPLKRPAHFVSAVGREVTLKVRDEQGTTRVRGHITGADDETVAVETADGTHRVAYGEIVQARTVFEWGGSPKPGSPSGKKRAGS